MENALQEHITQALQEKGSLTKRQLMELVKQADPAMTNEKTIGWRIYDLKQRGIISQLTRGVYTLPRKAFVPQVSAFAKALLKDLEGVIPFGEPVCLTETGWLNDWMVHQVFTNYVVIEPEKTIAETVFRELQYQRSHVFYDPDLKLIDLQLKPDEQNIIVKPIISEAPTENVDGTRVSSLEKMLVDLLCDDVYEAQREEADEIYEQTAKNYSLNQPRLRRYARRRNCETRVNQLLHDHTSHLPA